MNALLAGLLLAAAPPVPFEETPPEPPAPHFGFYWQPRLATREPVAPGERRSVPVDAEEGTRARAERALGAGFTVLETAHYRIYSKAAAPVTRDVGDACERLDSMFRDLLSPHLRLRPFEGRRAVILYRSREDYLADGLDPSRARTQGVYSPGERILYLYDAAESAPGRALRAALARSRGDERRIREALRVLTMRVASHEATHQLQFLANLWGTRDAPAWITEGMACSFGGAVDDHGRAAPGRADGERLAAFRRLAAAGRLAPLAEIVSAGEEKALAERFPAEADMDRFYTQSWALFYYLLHAEGGARREALWGYVRGLSREPEREVVFEPVIWSADPPPVPAREAPAPAPAGGDGADPDARRLEAFRKAFGGDLRRLEADLERYFREPRRP